MVDSAMTTQQPPAGENHGLKAGHPSSRDGSCCHTFGCHCYLTYAPPVPGTALTMPLAAFTYLPSASHVPYAAAPLDERLRPPIT
jgi:hypothetical protein